MDATSPYISYVPDVWSKVPPEGENEFGKEFNFEECDFELKLDSHDWDLLR